MTLRRYTLGQRAPASPWLRARVMAAIIAADRFCLDPGSPSPVGWSRVGRRMRFRLRLRLVP